MPRSPLIMIFPGVPDSTTESFPTHAIITLTLQSSGIQPRLGMTVNFTCTLASFILFPTFQLILGFEDGTNTSGGVEPLNFQEHEYTAEQSFSVALTRKLTNISCLAPLRSASDWSMSSLSISDVIHENDDADNERITETAAGWTYKDLLLYLVLPSCIAAFLLLLFLSLFNYRRRKVCKHFQLRPDEPDFILKSL